MTATYKIFETHPTMLIMTVDYLVVKGKTKSLIVCPFHKRTSGGFIQLVMFVCFFVLFRMDTKLFSGQRGIAHVETHPKERISRTQDNVRIQGS